MNCQQWVDPFCGHKETNKLDNVCQIYKLFDIMYEAMIHIWNWRRWGTLCKSSANAKECMTLIKNIDNGIKVPTCSYWNCNINRTLIFGGYSKGRKSLLALGWLYVSKKAFAMFTWSSIGSCHKIQYFHAKKGEISRSPCCIHVVFGTIGQPRYMFSS